MDLRDKYKSETGEQPLFNSITPTNEYIDWLESVADSSLDLLLKTNIIKEEKVVCSIKMRKKCKLWDLCCEKYDNGKFPPCCMEAQNSTSNNTERDDRFLG